ncbi:hypothetical protein LCGC14_2040040 [marine sediment metagenome]|uniref:Uncharacterized protein n=1 Tax=marine sediment metagenome TaxID=412755 RepID=A0A0F9ES26_9ZZZZ
MDRIEEDRKKQWEAILKLGKPQPDQSSRLLTDKWSDPKLHKYMSRMSCGYMHYDMNIVEMLEAQRDLTASIKDAEKAELEKGFRAEENETLIDFALNVATHFDECRDSRIGFIMQQAFGDIEWDECQDIISTVISQGKALKANPTSEVEG